MPRRAKGLSGAAVRTAKKGRHFDGDGLVLLVRSPEVAFWEFHYSFAGKRRAHGLGRARGRYALGLAEARAQCGALRRLVAQGADPIAARAAARAAAQAQLIRATSFRDVVGQYIAAHGGRWRSAKTAQ